MRTPRELDRFHLERKKFRLATPDEHFVKQYRLNNRLNLKSFMSFLYWLMPERVELKVSANGAYPIGSEYIIDVARTNI
jgi:hypothetical protein